MNENFNNYEDNERSENTKEADFVNEISQEPEQNVPTVEVISEPYRYKYENGEKSEDTRYNHYYYGDSASFGTQDSFYSTYDASQAQNTGFDSETKQQKKKKPLIKILKWVAGAACFGIIAGASFLGVSYFGSEVLGIKAIQIGSSATSETSQSGSTGNSSQVGVGTQLNITLGTTSIIEGAQSPAESVVVQVVDQNLAATVAVKSTFVVTSSWFGQYYQQQTQGSGSGFIVGMNETELLIATNNHVIEDAIKIEITFIDDAVLEATVKGTDTIADLAILAVPLDTISTDTLGAIRVATLGNSEEVRLGEMAIAIGNALGYGQSVTVGYISAKDREVSVDGNTMVLLQTDAAINGGNSGGPLFNTKGEVIGINSVKYADTDVEGMCFAIPISRAIPILNELMTRETLTDEEKGALGVTTRTVDDDIASLYGWPVGAYIVSVMEGSPAETANLYIGDIVTSVNGVTITTGDQLVNAISAYRHGTTVSLTIQRNVNGKYQEITIPVTLAKRSELLSSSESGSQLEEGESNSDSSGSSGSGSSGSGSSRPRK